MFNSFRVTREQAPNYELVNGKRGPGAAAEVEVAEAGAKVATKVTKTWGQRLKGWALNLIVGGVAASAGTDIYGHMNPNSAALGGGKSASTSATAGPSSATAGPSSTTASPGYAAGSGYATGTSGTGYAGGTSGTSGTGYAGGSSGTSGTGYAGGSSGTTGYTTTSGYGPATPPSIIGTTTATRAIAKRAREERALDHKLPADISSESSILGHV
jgi:hypothetical protein